MKHLNYRAIALKFISLLLSVQFSLQDELFQLSTISIEDPTVGTTTTLEFQLSISRTSSQRIQNGDQLIIQIPADATAYWDMTTDPVCNIYNLGSYVSCDIMSPKSARIVLGQQSYLILHGTISNFVNPQSTKPIENFQCLLDDKDMQEKMTSGSLTLNLFRSSMIDVSMFTSSNVIGANNVELSITITPETALAGEGHVILTVPEYYIDATNDYMFNGDIIDDCKNSLGEVRSCEFTARLMQLEIVYVFASRESEHQPVTFTVPQFNNPIVNGMGGFEVVVLDNEQFEIAETLVDVEIDGITEMAQFESYLFDYIDTPNSGQHSIQQITLVSSIPIMHGCIVRVVFPIDLKVDDELRNLRGTGIFEPEVGALLFDVDANTVEFEACQKRYGSSRYGVITFSKIRNQDYVHNFEESFKIYMTRTSDVNFEDPYQKIDEGWIIPAEQQKPGLMTGEISASNLLVQSSTSLTFDLQPSLDHTETAYIEIQMTQKLQFQGPSCSIAQSRGFSDLISCRREGHLVTIRNLFDDHFDAENQSGLSFTVEEFLTPTSVQPFGNIIVTTFDFRNGTFRAIDILDQDGLSSISGAILKVSEVSVGTDITSLVDQTYTFHFKITHSVPLGGYFSILLSEDESNGVTVTDPATVANSCSVVSGGASTGVECVSGVNEAGRNFVNVSCTEAGFGAEGAAPGSEVKLEIGGLTNPRKANKQSYIKIYTLDSNMYNIDENFEDEKFIVTMTQLKPISSIMIDQLNKTNGAETAVIITIVPSTVIHDGDIFSIDFPDELDLPLNPECTATDRFLIPSLMCQRSGEKTIEFTILRPDPSLKAGIEFDVVLNNAINSPSLRPTSPFSNMMLTDSNRLELAGYSERIVLTNQVLGIIDPSTAEITQTSYQPDEESIVTLAFSTNNALPNTSAIEITVPYKIPNVLRDECFVLVNDARLDDKCYFSGRTISVIGAFANHEVKTVGRIELNFKIMNPPDNERLNETSYRINIYDDESMVYGIDRLVDVLRPLLGCQWPCKNCLFDDPFFCTSCYTELENSPKLLHQGIDMERQICIDSCPPGYTDDGSRDPPGCKKCADTCATCFQGDADRKGDVNVCETCKEEFPFKWLNMSTCHAVRCPDGTYEGNPNTCLSCEAPCKFCSGPGTCTECSASNREKFLLDGQCLEFCGDGYTPIGFECIECRSPCATCKEGQIDACTSCDNTDGNQFLYVSECIAECPINTTLKKEKNLCVACETGCALCDDQDPTICLKCSAGLALLSNICREECPFEYVKSEDGSVCEQRTYPLDKTFVPFPILGTAGFFLLITLASYWLTGRRSLVSSTLIAIFGPIEMAACFYQFYYSVSEDRNYMPILIGSICVFVSGMVINVVFVVTFVKATRGKDKQFEKWSKRHRYATKCFIVLAATCSLTLYRLIYCRVFRASFMNARMNKPWPFLQHILMFTWIRFLVFNMPLIIVDLVGLSSLDWGNQCFMTMLESMLLSFISLGLMVWEAQHRDSLILREGKTLNLEKMELLGHESFPGGKFDDDEYLGAQPNKSKGAAFNKLQLDFDRDNILPATPRTLKRRVDLLQMVLKTVKGNKGTGLNGDLDKLYEIESVKREECLRRCKSMTDLKSSTHNQLADPIGDESESEKSIAESFPGLMSKAEQAKRLKSIHEYIDEYKQALADLQNKGDQYEDPVDDNVYAEAAPENDDVEMKDMEAQTEQEKSTSLQQDAITKMKKQMRDSIMEKILQEKREMEARRKKKKKQTRRGKRSFYECAIDEEDEDSEKSDKRTQGLVPTIFEEEPMDKLTLAMQIEKNKSLTQLWDLDQSKLERQYLQKVQRIEPYDYETGVMVGLNRNNESPSQELADQDVSPPTKGLELSRVSGDLDFSDDEDILEKDPEAKRLAEKNNYQNVLAWIKDRTAEPIHQRNFNENDIMGNFKRDWSGQIVDRDNTLRANHFEDRDGNVVNERGFLIEQHTGDIRSKYTFDVVFKEYNLIGVDGGPNFELPLPYRLERHNFNPQLCLGHFDWTQTLKEGQVTDKPRILTDKHGNRIDKNMRKVNQAGWLVDSEGNIIDNTGKVKFIREQLTEKGDLPKLFNYDGNEYKIKDIIGTFDQDPNSKDIQLCKYGTKNQVCDNVGRRVNATGYLLDERGNIIDKKGDLIWSSHELMFNEPPKIFTFTEFSMSWIKGNMDRDVTQNPRHDDHFDLDGNRINTMGYLIDDKDNIVDVFRGAVLFSKMILESKFGQEAEIPYIFRSGKLMQPKEDAFEKELKRRFEESVKKAERAKAGLNKDLDDEDVNKELAQLDISGPYGQQQDGSLAAMKDRLGGAIDDISMDSEQRTLLQERPDGGYAQIFLPPDSTASPDKSQKKKKRNVPKIPGKPRPMTGQAQPTVSGGYGALRGFSFRAGESRVNPDMARAQSAIRGQSRPGLKEEPIHISTQNFFPDNR